MVNPVHQHLKITVCQDGSDAAAKGYNYNSPLLRVKPIEIKEVVVVLNGTQGGNSTVDFILEDESGQKFVFMVTGNLLKSIPC